ncbi:iron-dicitrate ABC transporter ATP-binding protein [Actinorhabdospora filicis]|uniref:Iron-dicitrate ABC transporter ATP-binding protein n=1 Tax=Actinorhabdospora filicis TaxID=1785913 RepID=A0A9W6W8X9_9ACTN|nr:ABC transporter ATP-binding protein [Actinorhabdospora filicis]GLZ76100.1 iron-dicitrate ABC transporter ATP-binding protein [Actinorhabdospora filicis]
MQLLVEGLSAAHGPRRVLSEVDLTASPGTVTAIVGPNGCGKSTLLRCAARLHRPDAGRVTLGGTDIRRRTPRALARDLALLPQQPTAPEAITVRGLVAHGRHPHQGLFRQWSREDEDAAREALEAAGVADLADRRLDRLSGGQRQRCWLAMILAQATPVVLLDEPTSALDLGHQVEVLSLIRRIAAGRNATVVMVVHDLSAAARYADRLVAMADGRVLADGVPRAVLTGELVKRLYGIEADVLSAPGDGASVIVPRQDPGTDTSSTVNKPTR